MNQFLQLIRTALCNLPKLAKSSSGKVPIPQTLELCTSLLDRSPRSDQSFLLLAIMISMSPVAHTRYGALRGFADAGF